MVAYKHSLKQKLGGASSDRVAAAGGFFLVSRPGAGITVSPAVRVKFEAAMAQARVQTQTAYMALGAALMPPQQQLLRYCFDTLPGDGVTIAAIRVKLQQTLVGLQTADLQIVDMGPAGLAAGAQGYVNVSFGIKGRIHTDFNIPTPAETALNLIHEATHKFAGTADNGYMARGLAGYRAGVIATAQAYVLLGQVPPAPPPGPVTRARAVNNADSYACFAMNL